MFGLVGKKIVIGRIWELMQQRPEQSYTMITCHLRMIWWRQPQWLGTGFQQGRCTGGKQR